MGKNAKSEVPIEVRSRYTGCSLCPVDMSIQNTFSKKLLKYGLNFYELVLPDILHAIEQGAWRAVAIHLMRLVDALKGATGLAEVNRRLVYGFLHLIVCLRRTRSNL